MIPTRGWLSLHVAYHTGHLDRVVCGFVLPTVRRLARGGQLEAFFFVRYWLGGPHLRLRLLPLQGAATAVRRCARHGAAAFLRRTPSPAALPREEIPRTNAALFDLEAADRQELAYDDNSCQEVAFEPETERYGGPALLPHSLAYFTLSSCRALELLARRNGRSEAAWLTDALRLRARQALGFAADLAELRELAVSSVAADDEVRAHLDERADRAFAIRGPALRALVEAEVDAACSGRRPALADDAGAFRLSWELRHAAPAARRRILRSQLHMTANRLGLRVVDEIYLSRILWRCLEQVAASSPPAWARLGGLLARRREPGSRAPSPRLAALAQRALAGISTLNVRPGEAGR